MQSQTGPMRDAESIRLKKELTVRKPSGALLLMVRQHWGKFALSLLAMVVMIVIGFATPLLTAETVDSILQDHPSAMPEWILAPVRALGGRSWLAERLWIVGLALVLLNLVNGVFSYLKGWLVAKASESIAMDLREQLYNHLQSLPFAYHVKAETGDLIQRCTSDVETVRRLLAANVLEVFNAVFMIVLALIIMLERHVMLTVFSMILTPALVFFAGWFFKRVSRSFKDCDESEGRISAMLQENLTGVRVVRAFGQQEREVEKFAEANEDYRSKGQKVCDLLAIYWAGGDAITWIQTLLSLIVSIVLAIRGEITVGTVLIFSNYLGQMLFPIRQLGRNLGDVGKGMIAMGRIQDILKEKPEPEEPDAVCPPLNGDIVFDHVSFAYPDDGVPVLKDVSCTIHAGETVAVLGGTGSGKSTMMYLLQRLYEPTGGRITIGGVDIRSIDRKHLRAHVGLVLQEPFLYSRSIRENLGIAVRRPEENAIEHVVEIAAARDFISKSDKGYDTVVGERGVTLSGGQKQRIAIARTLMKDNNIIIFDDSLSAVDTETDAQIRAALDHEQQGITTLIISHRITTLSRADKILVLEDGCLTQQGTHAELCAQPGLYRRINNIQNDLEAELNNAKEAEPA